MSDLTEFLLARIAEDEAAAHAASSSPWSSQPLRSPDFNGWDVVGDPITEWQLCADPDGKGGFDVIAEAWILPDTQPGGVVSEPVTFSTRQDSDPNFEHIIRHDPVRVLAECEAKRRIVEWAADDMALFNRVLHEVQPLDAEDYTSGAIWAHAELLKYLALPYADHPDYREEWRP